MADHGDAEQAKSDDVDERTDHIARVVKDYLREGDAFLIQCQEGEILVEAAPPSNLEKEHPRLYGRLMSLNEQLDTVCMFITVLLAAGGLFCLGLHAGWWDNVITPNVADHLKSWWFYGPFVAALFFVGNWLHDCLAKRIYRQGRTELFALLREEGFDRDTLVPVLRNMPEFENIAGQLKRDRGPFSIE